MHSSKYETSTQCWASVVDGGPPLGRCLVFAGIPHAIPSQVHTSQGM